jgi:hypothetical protein
MATFVRVDNKTINMDLVFEIDDYGDRLRLFYAVASSDNSGEHRPSYSELRGTAADAIRQWVARNAELVADASPTTTHPADE